MKSMIVACLAACVASLNHATAQPIDLGVEIEIHDWLMNRTSLSTVTCLVETNSWVMEGDFLRNGRETWWFTGTNLVRQTVITKEAPGPYAQTFAGGLVGHAPAVGSKSTTTLDSADGNPGKPPQQSDLLTMPSGRIAWLAFCSGPCLRREGRKLYPPADFWKEFINQTNFVDHTTRFEDAMGLPKQVKLLASSGQCVLDYRVISSTNILGSEFPVEFYVAQYKPAPMKAPERGWILHFTARGKLSHIAPANKTRLNEILGLQEARSQ